MTEDLIIYRKTIPAREPEYADFPEKLHPNIVKFLKNSWNRKALYSPDGSL